MFEDFPNLHPLVVHLPIVLLMLSAALQALVVYKDWPQVKWITIGVMAGGFLGAVAASTYFHAMPMGLAPRAAAVFAAHEQYAGYTLWLSGITLLLAGIGVYFKLQRRAYEILVLVSAVATAGVLSVAGHRGAQLVYVEGVGPQGRLVMKGHHDEGGKAAMPGMEMGADTHDEKEGADHHEKATPATGQPASPQQLASEQMQGMDMSGSAASQQPAKTDNQRKNAMSGMGNMDMSDKSGVGRQQNTPRKESMDDMPGMNMKKQPAKGMDDMRGMENMPGVDMKAKPSPRLQQRMPAMPGMDMPQGTGKQPAGARKQPPRKGMEGMSGMENMPGMSSGGKQPAGSDQGAMQGMPGMGKGQAMPGMGSMPGMSMPASPLDKFRFEDNNPGRNKSKNDKQ